MSFPQKLVPRPSPPTPEVSVLVVSERDELATNFELGLAATVTAVVEQLGEVAHEVLVCSRSPHDEMALADLPETTRRHVTVIPASAVTPLAAAFEELRQHATAEQLLVVAPGAVPLGGALQALLEAARTDAAATVFRPRFLDPCGLRLAALQASGACLLVAAPEWPAGRLSRSGFRTAHVWDHVVAEAELSGRFRELPDAFVMTGGGADRALFGNGEGERFVDLTFLREGGRATVSEQLAVCLGSLDENVWATGALRAIHARHPDSAITVLTHTDHYWVFAGHPAVEKVCVAEFRDGDREDPWAHDACLLEAVRYPAIYDRVWTITGLGLRHDGLRSIADACGIHGAFNPELFEWNPGGSPEVRLPAVRSGAEQKLRVHAHLRAGAPEERQHIDSLVECFAAAPGARLYHLAAAASCRRRGHARAAREHEAASIGPSPEQLPVFAGPRRR